MKRTLLAILIASMGIVMHAQNHVDKLDVVTLYLKKGMIIRGKIIKQVPGESITVLDNRGDTLWIRDSQIKKYHVSEPLPVEVRTAKDYDFQERGFYQASTLGLILNTIASEDGGLTGWEMSASAGYLNHRLFGAGVGVSADFYHPRAGEMIFPLFFEMRGYLLAQPSAPYYVVRTGYGFAFKNENLGIVDAQGGWMINPAAGWRFGDGQGLKMTLDLGLKFQKATFNYRSGSERSTAELVYKRLGIRVGFLF